MIDSKTSAARKYSTPTLAVYGEFSTLTASGSTMMNEGTGMAMDRMRLP